MPWHDSQRPPEESMRRDTPEETFGRETETSLLVDARNRGAQESMRGGQEETAEGWTKR